MAAADGRSRWTTTVGTDLRHVQASGGTVLAVRTLEGDTEVVTLDPDDGRERTRYSTGSESVDVVLAGRHVILTRRSGTIRVIRG